MKKSIGIIVIILWIVAFNALIIIGRENGANVQEAGILSTSENLSIHSTKVHTIYHNGRTYDVFTRFNTTHFEVIRVD